ncbi:MAG TPA: response regulator [Phycisphaerae bacterium]|nr:response regulator [Phycisphaerales bacterium]HRX86030.1 response regulator [Phycisphaerae bacterium]
MRVLVIEDNPKMAAMIQQGLGEQGYNVDVAHRGHDGQDLAASGAHELIILDIMLPDMDGIDVCRNLRRIGLATPVLMLTALSETRDKILGLDSGADDYLTKPFEFDELLAHVRALLRRAQATESTRLTYHDLEMDLQKRTVTRQGERIALSNKEFMLLEYLLRNPERVLARMSIAERVWDLDLAEDSNVIDVCVSTLRKKVDKPFEPKLIHTVVGTGYVLSIAGPPA